MVALAAGCVAIGLLAPVALVVVTPVAAQLTGVATTSPGVATASEALQALGGARVTLTWVSSAGAVLLLMAGLFALARRWALARREVGRTVTWDCGYAAPSARMQYTASSFAEPITTFFSALLSPRATLSRPKGLFPRRASFEEEPSDPFRRRLFEPLFGAVEWVLARLRWIQHGRLQLYVLYIAVTLLVLLLWKLG
jgi:hypothetical protein